MSAVFFIKMALNMQNVKFEVLNNQKLATSPAELSLSLLDLSNIFEYEILVPSCHNIDIFSKASIKRCYSIVCFPGP